MTGRQARRRAAEAIVRSGGGGTRRLAKAAGVVVDHGRGSYLHTTGGARYLDAVSAYGVASLGHCHPDWVDAVVSQARRLGSTPLHTEELARYLTALSGVLPAGLGQTALFSGGAEAVEAAVRLTQTATGRPGVLSFADSFHGKTLGVRYSGGQRAQDDQLVPPWLRIASFPVCSTHDALTYSVCEDSGAEALTQLTQRSDLNDVGAVLVEPVLGTAGNIPPPRRFLAGLRALCDERGWLLIFDEMITGFGRSGKLFASEYFGVIPDVLVLGKGLGGGFPLSAVCASQELWERSVLAEPSATATSYGGNPIACAAGMATLEIVTAPRFLDDVGAVGAHLAQRLVELAEASPLVGWPRGLGLMLGFDLLDARTGDLATGQDCAAIFRACLDRGVLLAADTPRVRVSPPLTLTLAEADELAGVLFEVLA